MKRFMIHAPKSFFAALVDGFIQCQYIMTTSIIQDFFGIFPKFSIQYSEYFPNAQFLSSYIQHFLIFERYRGALSPKKEKS